MKKRLDQFYTNHLTAYECVLDLEREVGRFDAWSSFVEPSAGSGNFLKLLPANAIGVDIDPRCSGVIKEDYMTWTPPEKLDRCLVIGNPPFGKNSSLAVNFFNKSATFADTIAFILPRTFRKSSIVNRLDAKFHLVYERVLPIDSFHTPEGDARAVSTCFQIWRRSNEIRKAESRKSRTHSDWDWVSAADDATHAIRRVGAAAGKLVSHQHASPASHFFIRSKVDDLDARWEFVWTDYWLVESNFNPKWDVAGNPSLTKEEIVFYYELALKNRSLIQPTIS